ncbi:fungal-specific transcription factor domain-containing protein [Lentinula raphanica]|nr:fungal-specific transcription factor domain-containing protein [Lentinula raphanica]
MPVVASSAKASSRRKEKYLSPEELKDIEQKRLRGELSCAECRRLKLRCDKKLPCSSCSRRGCESICPCGTLEAGAGTRFILASTDQLHSKISLMSSRIRALEDALAIFQASVSSERHPLLEDDLLKIKFGSEVKNLEEFESPGSQQEESTTIPTGTSATRSADATTLDAFGTLTLGEEGEMKYFGRSAGSETLILAGENYVDSDEEQSDPTPTLSPREGQADISNGDNGAAVSTSRTVSPVTSFSGSLSFPEEDRETVPPEVYALALDLNQGTQVQFHTTVSDLLQHLPPHSRAEVLAQSYIDHASLFFRAMKKDEIFDVVLPLLYPTSTSALADPKVARPIETQTMTSDTHSNALNKPTSPSPHLLAVAYFTFALGSFFELSASVKMYVSESQIWFDLGRRALVCSRGGIAHPTASKEDTDTHTAHESLDNDIHKLHSDAGKDAIAFAAASSSAEDTVRALGLMATYCSMSGKKHARDSAWCGMSLAAKVAQGSGMHRDPARWHMDPATVQRRRALWWEVCTSDISHSVALGRPPSIHLSFVDCEFPTDEEATLSDTGEEIMGFWRMKYTFAKESFTPVISTTLTAKSPTYSTIMDLDRKIRELSLPPGFKPYVSLFEDGPEIYHNSHLALRDFYASQHRTVTMLYLHRSFFAHAMLTHPSNPLMSPFALSFLAAYRAASVIIKAAVHFYDRCPAVVPRVWFLTYHVFSAAMTVGTVVKRSPNSSIAKSALKDLGQALDLFQKCANSSPRNRIAYALLRRLKGKADRAYASFLAKAKESTSPSLSTSQLDDFSASRSSSQDQEGMLHPSLFARTPAGADDNELAIWGGKTSLLNGVGKKKAKAKGVKASGASPSQSDSSRATVSPSHSASPPAWSPSAANPILNETDVNNPSVNSSVFPGLHSETSWDDAMDAQMNFDANLDLSSLFPTNSLPSITESSSQGPLSQMTMDFNAPMSSNVDLGFSLGLGFGAGPTGLLMDMALEDIGPDVHYPASSTSNYEYSDPSVHHAVETNKRMMLMEYLSGTADSTSVQSIPTGFLGLPYGDTNSATTSWSNSDVPNPAGVSPNGGMPSLVDVTPGTEGQEFDARVAELYTQYLNYCASIEHPQDAQTSASLATSMLVDPTSMSTMPGLGWPEDQSIPPSAVGVETYDTFFKSLMESEPRVSGEHITDNHRINSRTNAMSSPVSNLDDRWAAFMHTLTRSGF